MKMNYRSTTQRTTSMSSTSSSGSEIALRVFQDACLGFGGSTSLIPPTEAQPKKIDKRKTKINQDIKNQYSQLLQQEMYQQIKKSVEVHSVDTEQEPEKRKILQDFKNK